MPADPHIRYIAEITTIDGMNITVGVDYDSVDIVGYRLSREQAEEFGRAFVAACWEAADNARLMTEGATGG